MKPILPLWICTLALSGCFTVTVPEEPKTEQSDGETPDTVDVPVNRAPTISGSAINVIEVTQPYSFIPQASDEDGDTLTFEIENKPNWGNFNGETGELSGQPNNGEVCSNIIISVTDGEYSTSLASFDITVIIPNRAPTISGSPSNEIEVNTSYAFTPAAQDADNDTLTYTISNKPGWASFDPATGKLSGTPTTSDTFNDIIISVKDGEYTASLNAFNISVLNPALYEVTLNWQAPTEDMDGNDIGGISAYKIFYGNTQGNPDKHLTVNDGSVEAFTISNLEPGDYYFTMSTVGSNGMESDASNEFYFQVDQ